MNEPNLQDTDTTKPRVSRVLIVMALLPLVALAAAVATQLSQPSGPPATATATYARVGSLDQPMPETFEITALDGTPMDLRQYRGRPVFVNFWGTWCPPCVDELPEMQAFAAAQGENGAAVVAANNSESVETITAYFEEHRMALPDIQFVLDPESTMYRWFGVFQMPTTYLVDEDGVVRDIKYGAFDAAEMQAYLDKLAASAGGS